MNRKFKMGIGLGGPSIIMIFVVLCMTTLSALSLMTANADWKLSKKAAGSTEEYYAADSKAEEILAECDEAFNSGHPAGNSFTIPVNENQDLILKLAYNESGYTVLARKLVMKSQWNYDEFEIEFDDSIN
jgi:hypothetical protein